MNKFKYNIFVLVEVVMLTIGAFLVGWILRGATL